MDRPESAPPDDTQYHLYVRQKIEQGLEDIEAGRVVTQEEVVKRLAKWLGPSPGLRPPSPR